MNPDDLLNQIEVPTDDGPLRVLNAMLDTWGDRCASFDEHCEACLAWAEYDNLLRARAIRIMMEQLKELYYEAMSNTIKH